MRGHHRAGNAVLDGVENLRVAVAGIGTAGNGQARPDLARRAIGAMAAGAGGIVQAAAFIDGGRIAVGIGEGLVWACAAEAATENSAIKKRRFISRLHPAGRRRRHCWRK